METIKKLVSEKYNLFNVNSKKMPVGKTGIPLNNWSNLSYNELINEHNYNSTFWGMRMGLQENGRYILSLDFDTCGQSINGERVGCEYTENKLREYLENIEAEDGIFSSSTQGNYNVLIDYTNSITLRDYIQKLGVSKINMKSLEILFLGNQVIPPTRTICKKTKELGEPRTFLKNENIFYVIQQDENFIVNFIKSIIGEKNIKKEKIEDHNYTLTSIKEKDEQYEDEFIELLFNVIRNERDCNGVKIISADNWFQICGILKYNGYSKKTWLKWTGLISQTDTSSKKWDAVNKNTPMNIRGLQNIAKEVNPEGYKKWIEKYYITKADDFLQVKIISEKLKPSLFPILKRCKKEWYALQENNLWKNIEEPTYCILKVLHEKLDVMRNYFNDIINKSENNEEKHIYVARLKDWMKLYNKINSVGYISLIVKNLKTILEDENFYEKLDVNVGQLVFQNGMVNLKTGEFREGILPTDYITKTIPYNYKKGEKKQMEWVRRELLKINNNKEEHLNYYLSSLAYSLTGEAEREQIFYYLFGLTAQNGKSVIFETLESLMPNYVKKGVSTILDVGSDLKKEVATWKGLRLLWLNEMTTKKKDPELIKALADGTSYKFNKMYSIEAETMKIGFKLFCVSNHSLHIDVDNGVQRRFKMMELKSKFKDCYKIDDYEKLEFKADKDFSKKLKEEYRDGLFQILIDYAVLYYNEGLKLYPEEWTYEKDICMDENDRFKSWFFSNFEIDENGRVSKGYIDNVLNESEFKNKRLDFRGELKRLCINFRYEWKQKCDGYNIQGVYYRFKKIDEVDEEEDKIM
jgi:phage/plasmid-associated DNA primase